MESTKPRWVYQRNGTSHRPYIIMSANNCAGQRRVRLTHHYPLTPQSCHSPWGLADGLHTQQPSHSAHITYKHIFTHPTINSFPPLGFHLTLSPQGTRHMWPWLQDVHPLGWSRPGCLAYHHLWLPRIHLRVVVPILGCTLDTSGRVPIPCILFIHLQDGSVTMDIQQWGAIT